MKKLLLTTFLLAISPLAKAELSNSEFYSKYIYKTDKNNNNEKSQGLLFGAKYDLYHGLFVHGEASNMETNVTIEDIKSTGNIKSLYYGVGLQTSYNALSYFAEFGQSKQITEINSNKVCTSDLIYSGGIRAELNPAIELETRIEYDENLAGNINLNMAIFDNLNFVIGYGRAKENIEYNGGLSYTFN